MENEKLTEEIAEEVTEVTEETAEASEMVVEEVVAEEVLFDSVEAVFAAMVTENDGVFPADAEKAALRFSELAPAMVREARLVDVFLACGGSADLVAVKEETASAQADAVKAVVEEMYLEYWIDKEAAETVCGDFLKAIGAEAAAEEETVGQLADRYFFGNDVPQDKEKAAELYAEAGMKGDMNACYSLGYMYDKGDGIDKDRDKAMLWYEKAADLGHEGAQNRLGILKNLQAQAQPACGCVDEEEPKKKKGFFCRK
ncbi:MAG: sel1 repeat family protein [Firmicutes bacterium]|nr:sel1 repeat family protein [Bacillota bacterium]